MTYKAEWKASGIPEPIEIPLISGDDLDVNFDMYDGTGAVVAATGATITLTVKTGVGGTQLFTKSVGSGITISTNPTNRFTVAIAAANTTSADPGTYYWDCEVTLSSVKRTVAWGTLVVIGDIAV